MVERPAQVLGEHKKKKGFMGRLEKEQWSERPAGTTLEMNLKEECGGKAYRDDNVKARIGLLLVWRANQSPNQPPDN